MTEIYLLTGFLGSGKTTFLNQRLTQETGKVGVLMNEFGSISMDSVAISKESMSFVELTNGSIFCSCLKENFIKGLIQLIQSDLDVIYIESSGLSDPSDMGKVLSIVDQTVLKNSYLFAGTLCLVDGLYFFQELEKLTSVERQIKHSHVVIINKLDLISEEKAQLIRQKIMEINPRVSVMTSQFGYIHQEKLMVNYFDIDDEITSNTVENKPKHVTIEFRQSPKINELVDFLKDISRAYYRIKGYVEVSNQVYKLDLVNNRIDVEVFRGHVDSEALNKLVCLASNGMLSISCLAQAAHKWWPGMYKLKS